MADISICYQNYSPGSLEFSACLAANSVPTGSAPASGGGSPNSSGSSPSANSGGWQQWINPQTIAAGATTFSAIAGLAQKTPQQKDIISVCGRKPLLNINGSKDKYQACANNYMAMKNQPVYIPPAPASSNNTIVIILLVFLILIAIVTAVIMARRNTAPVVVAK